MSFILNWLLLTFDEELIKWSSLGSCSEDLAPVLSLIAMLIYLLFLKLFIGAATLFVAFFSETSVYFLNDG
jgi:hypothetical protein